ncbi:hypothetical protein B11447_10710 [Campylobacter jejuni]|nr:hypothetical protein B11447_10710 [Campylobacter jejuni]
MLKSLFNVANKVSTVSQNENELAKKVENMVNQVIYKKQLKLQKSFCKVLMRLAQN